MEILLQQIINGLVLGSMYALVALGYTMVYGIINLINFAHGEVLMVGALTSWSIIILIRDSAPWMPGWMVLIVALVISCVVAAVLNFTIEKVAYRPLRGSFRLAPLITAIGMSITLSNFVQVTQGPRNKPIPPLVSSVYNVFGLSISLKQILIMILTVSLLATFWYIVNKTALGRAQRATEQDRKMAALLGIDVDKTISITFVMGAALAAVAGTMYLMYYGVIVFTDGFTPGVKAFTAAVLGGIGSLPGAVLGGLMIGLIESLWSAYFTIDYKDVATFSILAIVLIFKPSGILGRPEVEKV